MQGNPRRSCPVHLTTTNTLKTIITSVIPSPAYTRSKKVAYTAACKCICNDSFTDVMWIECQCIVVVLGSCPLSLQYQKRTSHYHCLFSLYVIMVTTLWLKQPTCFCGIHATYTFQVTTPSWWLLSIHRTFLFGTAR